jgi:hypothetical protein
MTGRPRALGTRTCRVSTGRRPACGGSWLSSGISGTWMALIASGQDEIVLPPGRFLLAVRTTSSCPHDDFVLREDEIALPSGRFRPGIGTSSPCPRDDCALGPGRDRLALGTISPWGRHEIVIREDELVLEPGPYRPARGRHRRCAGRVRPHAGTITSSPLGELVPAERAIAHRTRGSRPVRPRCRPRLLTLSPCPSPCQ